jgi:hypothetical protein
MALLVDGNVLGVDDLRLHDSSLLDMTSLEGIDLTSKCIVAQREIEERLKSVLRREEPATLVDVTQIVVTEGLRRWIAFRTLELVYQDAHFSQLNDRYGARWKQYCQLSRAAELEYLNGGIGITTSPLHKPAAPEITLDLGSLAPGTYFIRTTWVNSLGREGEPGPITTVTTNGSQSLSVRAKGDALNAIGWHIYAGQNEDAFCRQSASPLPLDTNWDKAGGTLSPGPGTDCGQSASVFLIPSRAFRRG